MKNQLNIPKKQKSDKQYYSETKYDGNQKKIENCYECPKNGYCENGKLICFENFIRNSKDECVENYRIQEYSFRFLEYLKNKNGQKYCEDRYIKNYLTKAELPDFLFDHFKDDEFIHSRDFFNVVFNKMEKNLLSLDIKSLYALKLETSLQIYEIDYKIFCLIDEYPYFCKKNSILSKNCIWYIIAIIFLLFFFFIYKIKKNMNDNGFAKTLYNIYLKKLSFGPIPISQIIDEITNKYGEKQAKKTLPIIDKIRLKNGRVSICFARSNNGIFEENWCLNTYKY